MHNEIWQAFFQSVYPVWAVVGVLVALNYGRVARAQWIVDKGTWGGAIADWARICWRVFAGCARDVWCLVRLKSLPHEPPPPIVYSLGHLLRLFIMLSFFTSAIFGFMLQNVDRSGWSLEQLLLTAVAVLSSMLAGLGHLYVAWHFKPRQWRWTCLLTVVAVPALMVCRLAW